MSAFGGITRLGKALRTCAVSVALTGSFAIAGARAGESPVISPSSSVAADAGTPAPEEAGRPVCARLGTRSEGWAWPSGRFIHWAKCKGMVPKCHAAKDGKDGRDVEGWYANGALIAPARCSDPDGNFPVFTEHFHGLLVRCQNAHLGRFENFWSSEPTSVVHLVEADDILDKMTYAFTNPTAADLVDTIEEWPGVTTFHATLSGGHITATRPKHFFRDNSSMPEVISI